MLWAAAQFRHYAPALYASPMWGTSDAIIPFRRFWAEYALMAVQLAQTRLQVSLAVAMAMGGEEMEGARNDARRLAFPDVTPAPGASRD